jgi:hypothetical protein
MKRVLVFGDLGIARRWVVNLALLTGSLLLAFMLAELATRLIAPQRFTPAFIRSPEEAAMYQPDPQFGFVLRPQTTSRFIYGTTVRTNFIPGMTVRTNALGLRDHEYAAKQPDEFRILSLGDSYAFGLGVEVEQSYGKVLEGLLNHACTGIKISVINAGVSGYGTVQQQLSFSRLRVALKPDFVIASFTAGNDVDENALFEEQLRTRLQTPPDFLARYSHVVRLLEKVTFPAWFFLANRDADNIEHTISLLKQLTADFDSERIPFVMLIIPARHQIRPSVEPGSRLLMALGFNELVFRQNRAVEQHFVQDGVPYIDLWPALVAEDAISPVSFADDSHLNPHGHEIAAGVIERYVQNRFAALVPKNLHARCAGPTVSVSRVEPRP